jgi:seryl-tRNA synthetase
MPVMTPDIIRTSVSEACGFQPRSAASQTFHLSGHGDLCLAATSEIPLAGMLHTGSEYFLILQGCS